MDQRMLVERAKRGDHDAFAVLAGAAIARLDAAARLILRDPELARDAVQEALIRAWRDLPVPSRSRIGSTRGSIDSPSMPVSTSSGAVGGGRSRSRSPRSMHRRRLDLRPLIADRDLLDQALRRLEPEYRAVVAITTCRDAAARGGGRPGHPARDGQVPIALLARRDACWRSIDRGGRGQAPVPGGQFA